jgi:hypothetical protein
MLNCVSSSKRDKLNKYLNTGGSYMQRHSTHTASLFSVLINVLIFSLCLAGVAAAQSNTSLGTGTLQHNITGSFNTAIGLDALFSNTTGDYNTASGLNALLLNSTGSQNPPADPRKGSRRPSICSQSAARYRAKLFRRRP